MDSFHVGKTDAIDVNVLTMIDCQGNGQTSNSNKRLFCLNDKLFQNVIKLILRGDEGGIFDLYLYLVRPQNLQNVTGLTEAVHSFRSISVHTRNFS